MPTVDIKLPQMDDLRDRLPDLSDLEKIKLDHVARRSAEVLERATGRRRSRPWGWFLVGGVIVAGMTAFAISLMDRTSARWPAPLRRQPSIDVQDRIDRAVAATADSEAGMDSWPAPTAVDGHVDVVAVDATFAGTANGSEF